MNKVAVYYKGKWFVLTDEDQIRSFDFVRKEIDVEYVTGDGLAEHVSNCLYYGIPAYLGKDKELNKRIKDMEKLLTTKE